MRATTTDPAAVVFDLDGTLVLSEARNHRVWESFFSRYGLQFGDELRLHVTGRRGRDSLSELLDRFPDRSLAELVAEVDEIDAGLPAEADPVPGAVALVQRLTRAGVPLGLVTSASRRYAEGHLTALGIRDSFGVLVTAEDVTAGKPDPEGFLQACDSLGVRPADAVGVEDSPAGVAAVRAAGMRCVAVATTSPPDRLDAADVVVESFEDLTLLPWPALGTAAETGAPHG